MLLLAIPLVCWGAYYVLKLASKPEVRMHPDCPFRTVIQTCATLHQTYWPTFWCLNGHFQTIASFFIRRRAYPAYKRELVIVEDGGTLALDWTFPSASLESDRSTKTPVVLVLHGVTGGSSEKYVTHAVQAFVQRGWVAVVYNQRGCGGSPLTSDKMYCAAASWDCDAVVKHVQTRFPNAPLVAVGYSMGANVLVKYLGENGSATPVLAGISCGNPLNLTESGQALRTGLAHTLYGKTILKRVQQYLKRHQKFVSTEELTKAKRCGSLWEFDDQLTSKKFGFENAEDYYAQASSCTRLPDIHVPLLVLNAEDDPIAPVSAVPKLPPPNVVAVVTRTGGHLGWLEGWKPLDSPSWADRACVEFFDALLRSKNMLQ